MPCNYISLLLFNALILSNNIAHGQPLAHYTNLIYKNQFLITSLNYIGNIYLLIQRYTCKILFV